MHQNDLYRHTQPGWVVWGSLAAVLLIASLFLGQAPGWIVAVIATVTILVGVIFGSLTVRIDEEAVEARFGPGPIRRRIPLGELRSVGIVRNSWYYGWGIRLVPRGWMYNVSGLNAVELELESGRVFRIGTDQPRELEQALRRALGPRAASAAPRVAGPEVEQRFRPRVVLLPLLIVIPTLSLVGFGLWRESRPPRVEIADGALQVAAFLYRDSVPLATIRSLALEPELPAIRTRTNGFAAGNLLRGSFTLADGRKARLYLDRSRPPFLIVEHASGWLLIEAGNRDQTRALHDTLRERSGELGR